MSTMTCTACGCFEDDALQRTCWQHESDPYGCTGSWVPMSTRIYDSMGQEHRRGCLAPGPAVARPFQSPSRYLISKAMCLTAGPGDGGLPVADWRSRTAYGGLAELQVPDGKPATLLRLKYSHDTPESEPISCHIRASRLLRGFDGKPADEPTIILQRALCCSASDPCTGLFRSRA